MNIALNILTDAVLQHDKPFTLRAPKLQGPHLFNNSQLNFKQIRL